MQVSTEKKEGLKYEIKITVPADQMTKHYQSAMRDTAKNARLDGFRKGHIPTKILEQQFMGHILEATADAAVKDTIWKAIEETKLKNASRPEVKFDSVPEKDKDFTYAVEIEVEPEIELKPLADLKLKTIKGEVTEQDIDKMVETLRLQQAKWQVKDDLAVGEHTMANIDFLGKSGGVAFAGGEAKGYDLNVDRDGMIPGFTDQIKGHKAGEKFTIQVKFPDNYQSEELKGKEAEFDITVNTVSEQVLPEIDDAFLKMYSITDGKVESLRIELRKNMERELTRGIHRKNTENVRKALLEQYGEFDVPTSYVEAEINNLRERFINQMSSMYGMPKAKLPPAMVAAERFKEEAVVNNRFSIVVVKLANELGVTEPSEEYIESQLKLIAGSYDEPEEVIKQIRADRKQMSNVRAMAYDRQIIDAIMAKAADGEQVMSFDEIVGR